MRTSGNVIDLEDSEGRQAIVQAGESCNITASLMNGADAITKASLLTLTLSLFRESTGEIINSREDQDILDANNCTVSAAGAITIRLDPADNVVASSLDAGETENHIARVSWTWNDGVANRTGKQELRFAVQQLTTLA